MEKKANPNILIPFAEFFGMNTEPTGLPQLSSDAETNKIAWNSLGNAASISAVLIGLKLAANHIARKEMNKARNRAHENKVNALYAYSTPNTAPQTSAVKKVRSLGVSKESSMEKSASVASMAVPAIVGGTAALIATKIVSDKIKDEAKDEVDEKLADARNRLDALYAKLLKLRLKKSASAFEEEGEETEEFPEPENEELPDIQQPDEDDEDDEDEEEEKKRRLKALQNKNKQANQAFAQQLRQDIANTETSLRRRGGMPKSASMQKVAFIDWLVGVAQRAGALGIMFAAGVAGLSGLTVYNMTKDRDEERKRKKLLEKQIYAQNLMNTPNRVEVLLGKHAPFPTDASRQTYIREIADSVEKKPTSR